MLSLQQELTLHPLRDKTARRSALLRVEADPRAFEDLDEGLRGDPDIALAAVGADARAAVLVPGRLREERWFALELVRRNRRALEFLPDALRSEPSVVRAAAAEDPAALELAPAAPRGGEPDAPDAPGAGADCYQGEGLRLVGFCNKWRTSDSELRLRAAPSPPGTSGAVREDRSLRHLLTLHLHNGCLSFQLVSATRHFAFRVFPAGAPKGGFYGLADGEGQALGAAFGGSEDGHGRNFYIDERAGAVVTIHAQLPLDGAEGARVWYTLEGYAPVAAAAFDEESFSVSCPLKPHGLQFLYQGSVPVALPSVAQRPFCQKPMVEPSGEPEPDGPRVVELVPLPSVQHRWMILVNPEVEEKRYDDLMAQARKLSKASFARRFYSRDLAGSRHLALLVDMQCTRLSAYCLLSLQRSSQELWLEQCAVAEDAQGRGPLAPLADWALARARAAGCRLRVREANGAAALELAERGLLRWLAAGRGAELRADAPAAAGAGAEPAASEAAGALLCRLPEGAPLAAEPEEGGGAPRAVWPLGGRVHGAAPAGRPREGALAAAELLRAMRRVRASVAGSFPHSQCMRTAQALLADVRKLGLDHRLGRCSLVEGRFCAAPERRARWSPHCYLRFEDGSICDVTADQFGAFPQLWWPAEPAHYS